MLKILVCFKQVSYLPSRMAIRSDGKIDRDGVVYIPNPYDEVALEEALRIKEKGNQTEVVLVTIGPPRVEGCLRYGLAMGADWGIHICDEKLENIDHKIISKLLMRAIENRRFDIILCGMKAVDTNEGTVGASIAELLGFSYVSSVTAVNIRDSKKLTMFKILERGDRQFVECDLPVILSIGRGSITPRYPTLKERNLSLTKKIIKISPAELGMDSHLNLEPLIKISKISLLRPKPKKMFTPNSKLSASERMKLILSGGLVEKKTNLIEGPPQEAAVQFVNFIEENSII
jgi:electron transfer flavoprotein beta subunit